MTACGCWQSPKQLMISTTILLPLLCLVMFVVYNNMVFHNIAMEVMEKTQPITVSALVSMSETVDQRIHSSSGSVIKSLIRAKTSSRTKRAKRPKYIGSLIDKLRTHIVESKPVIHNHKEFNFLIGMERIQQEYNRTISNLQPIGQQVSNRRCTHQGKVFAIGLMKTGTTSMVDALNILGYHCSKDSCLHIGNWNDLIDTVHLWQPPEVIVLSLLNLTDLFIEQYVSEANQALAFGDSPWCFLYPVWDRLYPGSKYILMRRSDDSAYINSYLRYLRSYGKRHVKLGLTDDEFALLALRRYHLHNERVRQYFKHRPHDLLEIVIGDGGNAWTALTNFLGCRTPRKKFPHENKSRKLSRRFELRSRDRMHPQIDIRTDAQRWNWTQLWDDRHLIPFVLRDDLDGSHSLHVSSTHEFVFDWNSFLVRELRVPRPQVFSV